jgi:hypothetical protein
MLLKNSDGQGFDVLGVPARMISVERYNALVADEVRRNLAARLKGGKCHRATVKSVLTDSLHSIRGLTLLDCAVAATFGEDAAIEVDGKGGEFTMAVVDYVIARLCESGYGDWFDRPAAAKPSTTVRGVKGKAQGLNLFA